MDTIAPKKTEVRGSDVPRELQIASYNQRLNCKMDRGVKKRRQARQNYQHCERLRVLSKGGTWWNFEQIADFHVRSLLTILWKPKMKKDENSGQFLRRLLNHLGRKSQGPEVGQ